MPSLYVITKYGITFVMTMSFTIQPVVQLHSLRWLMTAFPSIGDLHTLPTIWTTKPLLRLRNGPVTLTSMIV